MSAESAVDISSDLEGGAALTPTNGDLQARIRELEDEVSGQAVTMARLEERAAAASEKAEAALEANKSWQASANEWRGTISDLTSRFATAENIEAKLEAIRVRLTNIETLHQRETGKGSAYSGIWVVGAGVVMLAVAVAGLALKLFGGGAP